MICKKSTCHFLNPNYIITSNWLHLSRDIFSILLFSWWGPRFIATGILLILSKQKLINFNWAWYSLVTSVACKINYVVFMVIYAWLGCYSYLLLVSGSFMTKSTWHGFVQMGKWGQNTSHFWRLLDHTSYVSWRIIYPMFCPDSPSQLFCYFRCCSIFFRG